MSRPTLDYSNHFNSRGYLDQYYSSSSITEGFKDVLKYLHEIFQSDLVHYGSKAVDVGCGPNIHTIVSATSKCDEIVMCDYLASNLNEIQKWIEADPHAFNWDHIIKMVCSLEGSNGPIALTECTERVRSKVKELLQCNVLQDKIFGNDKLIGPVDVVVTSLCLEAACSTAQEYKDAVARCAGLLRDGGVIIMLAVLNETFYDVADKKFGCFPLNEKLIREALEAAGCCVTNWNYKDWTALGMTADFNGFVMVTAMKGKGDT